MKSIRGQLTRRLVLGTLLVASCGGAVSYLTTKLALTRQFDAALLGSARGVCALVEWEGGDRIELEEHGLRPLGFGEGGTHYFLLQSERGGILERSPSLRDRKLSFPALAGSPPNYADVTLPGGGAGRVIAFQFKPQRAHGSTGLPAPLLSLLVATGRQSLDASLRSVLAALILSAGVLVLSTWLFVPRLLRRAFRPLDHLALLVTGITSDTLAMRLPEAENPAELAPITRRLNDLLARIETSFARERRFSADLAHELRTPLAELRSQAELALKWPDARLPEADAEALAIVQRMERLVTRLLALARAEGEGAGFATEEIALGEAIDHAWRPFAKAASERQLRLSLDVPRDFSISGDAVLLREILMNLFENAVHYSLPGGEVEVQAALPGRDFSIGVTNAVTDLEPADLEKMFDRFWRKETARSGDEHAGLGLAVARSYARALGWDLRAALEGTRLTLTLSGQKSRSYSAAAPALA